MEDIVTRLRRAVDNEPFMLGGEHDLLKDALNEIITLLGCCDGAAAQDSHVRREREEHRVEVERLREALIWYADTRNHFPVERRSPGDPDPAVIFVEEPPIMSDGGRRARVALEGKP